MEKRNKLFSDIIGDPEDPCSVPIL